MSKTILIVGGGAAGIFGAISAATHNRSARVIVLEATGSPLDKVRISGGGRCNVTHNCFDPTELVKSYPRGYRELRSIFSRFQPRDTVEWFENHGVKLKAELDGRMFPTTDNSATIVDCLLTAAAEFGVELRCQSRVKAVRATGESGSGPRYEIDVHGESALLCDRLLIATGNSPQGYELAETLGHSIVPCVPSLFTFKVSDTRLEGLSGISFDQVELRLAVGDRQFHQRGPMLITHWGLSGPAVLKLSAFAARELSDCGYRAELSVNLLPGQKNETLTKKLAASRDHYGRKQVHADSPLPIPRRYWNRVIQHLEIPEEMTWSGLTKPAADAIISELTDARFMVAGKGIFKEEFVTCGGVSLKEIDFKTMQSKLRPGLFLAGEILDIDGITGGFNFQSAWSTGWIAGTSMA